MWLRRDVLKLIPAAVLGLTDRYDWRGWAKRQEEPKAMATTVWQATTDDFANAPNWSNGVPSLLTDIAVFDGTSQVTPLTNLDRGAAAFAIRMTPAYRGGIGGSANPLFWTPPATVATHARCLNGKNVYLKAKAAAVPRYHLDCPGTTVVFDSEAAVGGVYLIKSGTASIISTCDLDAAGIYLETGRARCEIAASAVAQEMARDVRVTAGEFECARDANAASTTNLYFASGAKAIYTGLLAGKGFTYVELFGGRFQYTPTTQTATDCDVKVLDHATLDLSGNDIATLTGIDVVGPYAAVMPSPGDAGGVAITWDLREDYP